MMMVHGVGQQTVVMEQHSLPQGCWGIEEPTGREKRIPEPQGRPEEQVVRSRKMAAFSERLFADGVGETVVVGAIVKSKLNVGWFSSNLLSFSSLGVGEVITLEANPASRVIDLQCETSEWRK